MKRQALRKQEPGTPEPHFYELKPTDPIQITLKDIFGHSSFKPRQEEVVRAVLEGKDVFVSMPTSWGKSLCFQLPAVLQALNSQGVTLVVSPLLALMKDQIESLTKKGIPAIALNSEDTNEEIWDKVQQLKSDKLSLVYVSPERLITKNFQRLMKSVEVARLVVDEAHCVSMWGHDFRPSYQRIAEARVELGNPPISAFTATAPVVVRDDILQMLNMQKAHQIIGDPDRPNLTFAVQQCGSRGERDSALFEHIKDIAKRNEPFVVYCQRTKHCDEIAEVINKQMKIAVRPYHSKMEKEDKRDAYQLFMDDVIRGVIATEAFGLGIDKPNIRHIIHHGMPHSLEQYYQEAGRAGRDGDPASCHMFLSYSDSNITYRLLRSVNPTITTIQNFYAKLWSFVREDKRDQPTPSIFFNLENYFRQFDVRSQERQGNLTASLALLQEFGLIKVSTNFVTFMVRPEELEGQPFPISEPILNMKRERDMLRLSVMEYFVDNSHDQRQVILDHFRDNSVVAHLDNWYRHKNFLSDEQDAAIVTLLLRKDWNISDLNAELRTGKDAKLRAFEGYDHTEVRAVLEALTSSDTVRLVRTGDETFVSLGENWKEDPNYFHPNELKRGLKLEPTEKLSQLLERMHSEDSHHIIKPALEDWFSTAKILSRSSSDWWKRAEEFVTDTFTILGESVTGLKLVEAHFGRTYNRKKGVNPIKRHTIEFLNTHFNHVIKVD